MWWSPLRNTIHVLYEYKCCSDVALWGCFESAPPALFARPGTGQTLKATLRGPAFCQDLLVCSITNPRQTPGGVSTSEGSTAVDTRPPMVWGGRLTETSLWAAPTWLNFLRLFVIHPMQRLWSTHELWVVKQLWSSAPFAVRHPAPSFFLLPLTVPLLPFANSPPQLSAPPLLKRHISWCHY